MIPLQLPLDHTSFGRVELIVDALQLASNDIQSVKETEECVLLYSSIFPLKDFQPDESDGPAYVPQDGTYLFTTPLHLAAYSGKDDVVKLLSAFVDINIHRKHDKATPLFLSLINRHLSTAKLLLERGASLHGAFCANGLHAAARQGFLDEILSFIQDYHVEPDVEDEDGATPVMYALYLPEEHALETISLLFSLGAKADVQIGDYFWTYADLARAMGKEGLASWLESRASSS
ncbi:ankyrin repeat-containing domain protein [Thelonectria olida]|uniref:Ankyrin repeat-containing domain protein n=1 Tax=Thelonectria olida TaxID=1576542 RepID=A0A9P9AJU9_9HYPO|nr:ankyrin repeat-containing domain protein [Thelonectria olida]